MSTLQACWGLLVASTASSSYEDIPVLRLTNMDGVKERSRIKVFSEAIPCCPTPPLPLESIHKSI
jgi:hypothetical protein